jgi:Fe-S-cluster containining protein
MGQEPETTPETLTAHLGLSLAGRAVRADVTVPTKPIRIGEMLPVLQSLTDLVVGASAEAAEARGRMVSCAKGCGACCRQLVPISEPEARRIRDLVEALPEPRRSEVRGRFAEARRRLEQAGLLETLCQPEGSDCDALRALGLDYFAQQIACPFLDDESCSIHPDRPLACREYLVTSPAAHCARPSAETIERVEIPRSVWGALARVDPSDLSNRAHRWVPLVLAPEWADAHPDEPPPHPGPDLLRAVLERLTGTDIGSPLPPIAPGRRGTAAGRS